MILGRERGRESALHRVYKRPVQMAQQPARKNPATLFVCNAAARMIHEGKAGRSIVPLVTPELDLFNVFWVLVAVMRRGKLAR